MKKTLPPIFLLVFILSISVSQVIPCFSGNMEADSPALSVQGENDVLTLSNGYIYLEINLTHPLIQTIRYDSTGQASYGRDLCVRGYSPSWDYSAKGFFSEIINNTDGNGQGRERFTSNLAMHPEYVGPRRWSLVQNETAIEVKIFGVGYSNGESLIATSTWIIVLGQNQSSFSWTITDVVALENIRYVSQHIQALLSYDYTFVNSFNISMVVPDNMTHYLPSIEAPFIFQSPIDFDWKQISLYGNNAPSSLTIAVNSSWDSSANRRSYFGLYRNSTGSGLDSDNPVLNIYVNLATPLSRWTPMNYNKGENLPSQKYEFYLYEEKDVFFPYPSFNHETVYTTPNSTINQAMVLAYYVNLIHNLYQPGKIGTDMFDRYNQYGWKPDVWGQMLGTLPLGSLPYRDEYAQQIILLLDNMNDEGLLPEYFNMIDDEPILGSFHPGEGFNPNLVTIFMVHDYLVWTGNITWLDQKIGQIRKVWDFLNQNVKEGLLYADYYGSVDWDDWVIKNGYVSLPNMQLYRACLDMGNLEAMTGNFTGSIYYYDYANDLKNEINDKFWNGTFYISGIDQDGTVLPYFHAPTNQLAISLGITNSSQTNQIWSFINTHSDKNFLGTVSFYPKLSDHHQFSVEYDSGAHSFMNTVFRVYMEALSSTEKYEELFSWLWNFTYSFADPRNTLVTHDRGAYIYEWYDSGGSRRGEKGFALNAGDYLGIICEEIFGVQPNLWNLKMNANPPNAWIGTTYNITNLNFRETLFNVTIQVEGTTGMVEFNIDGIEVGSDGTVPSEFIDGKSHNITITLGNETRMNPCVVENDFTLVSADWVGTNLESIVSGPQDANMSIKIYVPYGLYPNDTYAVRVKSIPNRQIVPWGMAWNPSSRMLNVWSILRDSVYINIGPAYNLLVQVKDYLQLPVSSAKVEIYSSDDILQMTVISDKNGEVIFPSLPDDTYRLELHYLGFSSTQIIELTNDLSIDIYVVISYPILTIILVVSLVVGIIRFRKRLVEIYRNILKILRKNPEKTSLYSV